MIVNPYNEVISLHDMNINNIAIEGNKIVIKLNQAFLINEYDDYYLENPEIIINDYIENGNPDFPIRIKYISEDEVRVPTLDEFNDANFDILEEAYGFGIIHFYGIVTTFEEDNYYTHDCMIDIFYRGDLEIIRDDKILIEA